MKTQLAWVLMIFLGGGYSSQIAATGPSYVTDLMIFFIDKYENPDPHTQAARGPIVMRAYAALSSSATALIMTSYVLALVMKLYPKAPLSLWQIAELSPEFFLLVNKRVKSNDPDSELKYGLKLKNLQKLSIGALKKRIHQLDPLSFSDKEATYDDEERESRAFRDLFFTEDKTAGRLIKKSHLFLTRQERARYGERAAEIPKPHYALIFEGHGAPPANIEDALSSIKAAVDSHRADEDYEDVVLWGNKEIQALEQQRLQGKSIQDGAIGGVLVTYFASLVYGFFDRYAPVVLVLANSCYAGGVNLRDMITYAQKTLTPMTTSITLVITAALGATVSNFSEKSALFSYDDFKKYLTPHALNKEGKVGEVYVDIDIVAAVSAISPLYDNERFAKATSYGNISLVQRPGQEWTQTLVKLPSIGHILASSHNPSDPLNVRTFFGMKTVAPGGRVEPLLLYAPEILFPLVFDDKLSAFPVIIPMIQGDAVFTLSEVRAPTFPLSRVVRAFFSVEDLAEDKAYLIKTIKARDDITGEQSGLDTTFEAILLNKGEREQIVHQCFLIKKEGTRVVKGYELSCVSCEPLAGKICPRCDFSKKESWKEIQPSGIPAALSPFNKFVKRLKEVPEHTGALKKNDLKTHERQALERLVPRGRTDNSLERLARSLQQLVAV